MNNTAIELIKNVSEDKKYLMVVDDDGNYYEVTGCREVYYSEKYEKVFNYESEYTSFLSENCNKLTETGRCMANLFDHCYPCYPNCTEEEFKYNMNVIDVSLV